MDDKRRVGMRHGRPVILTVAAGEMARAGHAFFVSANGALVRQGGADAARRIVAALLAGLRPAVSEG